jgi:hypothetical protein
MGDWTVFRDKGKTAQGHLPSVSIHKGGRLSLNQAAYDALLRPAFVELLYDGSGGRIGFRAASSTDRHAYSVKQPAGSSRYYISAASFARHYGLDPRETYEQTAALEGDVLAVQVEPSSTPSPAPVPSPEPSPSRQFDPDDEFASPSDPGDDDEEFGGAQAPRPHEIDPDDIPF